MTSSENYHHRTCFQRTRPKPNAAPDPISRRSKPMSMMRSNTTSATSELMILSFRLFGLSRMQELLSYDHVLRSYGYWISLACPKQSTLNILPVCNLWYHGVCKKYSYDRLKVLTTDEEYDICHPHSHCD